MGSECATFMIEIRVITHHHRRILIAAVLFLALAAIVKLCTTAAFATDAQLSADERVVTVHDGGDQTGLVTSAKTLREVLQQAHIAVNSNDITEPSLDEPLVASSYEANIYRARPVVVQDGAKSVRIVTAYRTVKQIAKQAGMPLNDADVATMKPVTDIATEGVAEVMAIDRATPITFVFYGKVIQTSTRAKTVEDLLKERKVTYSKDDTVNPGLKGAIVAGATIELWRNGKQTVNVDEDVAFTTRQVRDANHDQGYKEVQTPGENGKRTVTYEIEMRNGIEVGRVETNAITTKAAVEQVEIIGTKANLPAGSHTDWMAAAGIAPSDYGYVDYIVGRESGWSPTKYNYGGSGAYGLCQALPASKMSTAGSDYMTNPITQLKWCNGYAIGRYGSWEGAYNFWLAKHYW